MDRRSNSNVLGEFFASDIRRQELAIAEQICKDSAPITIFGVVLDSSALAKSVVYLGTGLATGVLSTVGIDISTLLAYWLSG